MLYTAGSLLDLVTTERMQRYFEGYSDVRRRSRCTWYAVKEDETRGGMWHYLMIFILHPSHPSIRSSVRPFFFPASFLPFLAPSVLVSLKREGGMKGRMQERRKEGRTNGWMDGKDCERKERKEDRIRGTRDEGGNQTNINMILVSGTQLTIGSMTPLKKLFSKCIG